MEEKKTESITAVNIPIDRLLLDPNNDCFFDKPGFVSTPGTFESIAGAQQEARLFLEETNKEVIKEYITGFKEKGLFRVNYIQVKKLEGTEGNQYYLVLKGTVRAAALLLFYDRITRGSGEAGLVKKEDFEQIPVILHTGEAGLRPESFDSYLAQLDNLQKTLYRVSTGVSLEKILMQTQKGNISPQTESAPLLFTEPGGPFNQLYIGDYRKIKELKIEHLNRVNIIAGPNNSGKTTFLEAVYLLSQLNHSRAFLELERFRGKFSGAFNPRWLDRNMTGPFVFEADYGGNKVSLTIKKEKTTARIDKTAYLSSITSGARVNSTDLTSSVHLFSNREPEEYYEKSAVLCRAAFTSPYRYNENLLRQAHSEAVQNKFIDEIIRFITCHIDPAVSRIDMVNIEGESRFYVHSRHFNQGIDITKYGEGVQRIFEIALLFAYCKDGILCIDEFESAIHKSLLIRFSRFIQQLADRFNVQVFLSTHSKECIDGFTKNNYNIDQITAFSLKELDDGRVDYSYVKGPRLKSLVESINADVRG